MMEMIFERLKISGKRVEKLAELLGMPEKYEL